MTVDAFIPAMGIMVDQDSGAIQIIDPRMAFAVPKGEEFIFIFYFWLTFEPQECSTEHSMKIEIEDPDAKIIRTTKVMTFTPKPKQFDAWGYLNGPFRTRAKIDSTGVYAACLIVDDVEVRRHRISITAE